MKLKSAKQTTPDTGRTIASRLASDSGIEFGLFAPYNEEVQLLASWNEWKPLEMDKDPDGWWRIRAELEDGDYHYKFRVKSTSYFANGEMLDLFDPYGTSITNDGKENTNLRIRGGKRIDLAYEWKHDDVPLPNNVDLVIYELHIGDFYGKPGDSDAKPVINRGRFIDAIEKLDYLKDLGINCIELMPVKEFPGDGWGYSLRSLFAVENSYGTPEQLCEFIDECHARGIRVLIDGVYNHAEAESPLTKIAYEYWFYRENPDPKELHWGPKFNYTHYDANLKIFPARKYAIESIQYWVEQFHIDGIRFDATFALRDFNIMRELAHAGHGKVEGIKPFFTVAEHVPEDPAIAGAPDRGPYNAAWQDSLGRLLQAVITNQDRDGQHPWDIETLKTKLDPARNGYGSSGNFVNFIGNHDFHRILHMLANDAHIFDEAAFRRVKLGTALLLTAPGIPMLWMGQEFGFSADKSPDPRPLNWSLLENERNRDLFEFHKTLIHFRHAHAALRSDGYEVILHDQERLLLGYKRWTPDGDVVVVVANLKDLPAGEFELKEIGLEDGTWHEAINDYEVRVENGVLKDSLRESEVKVFYRKH